MIDFEKELSNFNLIKELDDVEGELETSNTKDILGFLKVGSNAQLDCIRADIA